jgi:hypothetical protein
MANTYKFKGVALATGSETALLTAATDEILIIKSILVTNNTGNTPTLSLDVLDNSASAELKHIEEVWHIVVKDIADALARSNGYALADHIKKWILEEKMQLWILWDQDSKEKYFGTVVTEVITRPLQRCLNIRIMTGKHREKWQHLIKHIEEFAWQNKCDLLELVARPGWKKVLKPFGYKESHILLEKKKEN